MFTRLLSTVLIIYFLASPAFAESLTLEQAIDIAVQNNPQLKAVQAKLGMSEADIKTAAARPNPKFVSNGGVAQDTYQVGIKQMIELGWKRKRRISVARAEQAVIQSEISEAILNLRADVRQAYTRLYLSQERQKAYEEILRNTEKLLDITQKREQAGDIAKLDVLQTDITVAKAKNDLQTLVSQLVSAKNQLNTLLNQPLNTSLILAAPTVFPQVAVEKAPSSEKTETGTLQVEVQKTDFNLDRLIEIALKNRPEIQQNENAQDVARQKLALAKANRIPNLSLSSGADVVIPGGNENQYNMFFATSLGIPIFNRQQGPIQKALAEQAQLQQAQSALKNQVILEVTNAYNAFFAHQDRVMRYETELFPKAQEIVEKSRRSFEEGKSSILIPLNAQQAYIDTRLGYLQAMVDMQDAISDLERAVGTEL